LSTLLLAFAAASLATFGGAEVVRMARLSAALGRGLPLLVAGWLACGIASLVAAWLGAAIAGELAPAAKAALVLIALLLAAVELTVRRPGRTPAEPTRAFAAVLLVLGARQLATAAALLVFALAAYSSAASLAAAGGALGSGGVLTAAWSLAGEWQTRAPLAGLRYGVPAMLVVAALAAGLGGGLL